MTEHQLKLLAERELTRNAWQCTVYVLGGDHHSRSMRDLYKLTEGELLTLQVEEQRLCREYERRYMKAREACVTAGIS